MFEVKRNPAKEKVSTRKVRVDSIHEATHASQGQWLSAAEKSNEPNRDEIYEIDHYTMRQGKISKISLKFKNFSNVEDTSDYTVITDSNWIFFKEEEFKEKSEDTVTVEMGMTEVKNLLHVLGAFQYNPCVIGGESVTAWDDTAYAKLHSILTHGERDEYVIHGKAVHDGRGVTGSLFLK